MIGRTISHYEILDKIGEGGMGVVYRARDRNLNRIVALKFLSPRMIGDEEEKRRFIREAQAEAAIEHPNICTIYEIEEADGQTFIAMAYIEGESLVRRAAGGPLRFIDALDIVIQVAEGLQEAHAKGIVHRDIKPANIMVAGANKATIMDFGLAKLTNPSRVTKTTKSMGTIAYMSPEQITRGPVDHRTDIWSLGVTLYELLTGRLPFRADYDAAFLYSIVNDPHEPALAVNPMLPLEIGGIINRALEKDPAKRYASMREMCGDLKEVRRRYGSRTESAIGGSVPRARSVSFRRSVLVPAIVIVAAIVALNLLGPYLNRGDGSVSLALVGFENFTGDRYLSATVSELLTAKLERSPRIRLLGAQRISDLKTRLGIEAVGLSDGLSISRHAGVRMMLYGSLSRSGDAFGIDARMLDVETGNQIFANQYRGEGEAGLYRMIDELAKDLSGELNAPLKSGRVGRMTRATLVTDSLRAMRYYVIGRDLHAGGDIDECIQSHRQAIAIDSTFIKPYWEIATLLDYLEKTPEAARYAERACDLAQRMDPMIWQQSLIHRNLVEGNMHDAVEAMKRYLGEDPSDLYWRVRLGYTLSRYEKRYAESIVELKKAVELDPDNICGYTGLAYNYLGHALVFENRFDEAMEAFGRYAGFCAAPYEPIHSMADAMRCKGRYGEAIAKYQEVIDVKPQFAYAYEGLGLAYLAVGRWNSAISAFGRYIDSAGPMKSPWGHVLAGRAYLAAGKASEAREEAEKALELDPNQYYPYCLLGCCCLGGDGDIASARRYLEQMEELRMNTGAFKGLAHLYYLKGLILMADDRRAEGIVFLEKALETSPRDDSVFFSKELARARLSAGERDRPIREALALLAFNDNDGDVLSLLGDAYEAMGEHDKSDHYYRMAASVWRDAEPDFGPLERIRSKLDAPS